MLLSDIKEKDKLVHVQLLLGKKVCADPDLEKTANSCFNKHI